MSAAGTSADAKAQTRIRQKLLQLMRYHREARTVESWARSIKEAKWPTSVEMNLLRQKGVVKVDDCRRYEVVQ